MHWTAELVDMVRIVTAIMVRGGTTRYAGSKFGYLWAFIEPLMLVAIFAVLNMYIRDRVMLGENMLVFVLTGFMTVRMSLAIARQVMVSITQDRTLLAFPSIAPIHLLVANIVGEAITMTVVLLIFYALLVQVSDVATIADPVMFTTAIGATLLLAVGFGAVLAPLAIVWSRLPRLFGFLSLPLLLCSGIFFIPAMMEPNVLNVLVWNPLLHCVEWFREALYLDYVGVLDRSYPLLFGTAYLFLGIVLTRKLGSRSTVN